MLDEKNKNVILSVLFSIFFFELIRTAWISDDAAITLRTVLNFIHGYGPTFNIDERVQAYTHPLWFLLLTGLSLIVKNVFASTFILSIGISLLTFWLLLTKVATNIMGAIIVAVVFILSKAYLDFSTSGLENPLSHLLIVSLILFGIRAIEQNKFQRLVCYFIHCGFLYLCRPDLILLVCPFSLLVMFKNRSNPGVMAKALIIGVSPAIIWTLFSLYYYGMPFPNTAYAKLGAGIPLDERIKQGLTYYLNALIRDPLTITFILFGVVIGLQSSIFAVCLSVGIVLYLIYIIGIGGDFMMGRFFTAPLLLAGIQVARSQLNTAQLLIVAMFVSILGLQGIHSTLLSNSNYKNTVIDSDGIADERGIYYQKYGLLTARKETFSSPHWIVVKKSVGVICGGLGFNSIFKGPGMHYIDSCALADPLLARLPAKYDPHWRIGHFYRQLPTNYKESIKLNKNILTDTAMHTYYDSIRKITRGKLNDASRLSEIIRFNLGLIRIPEWDFYRNGTITTASHGHLLHKITQGSG